MNQHIVLLLTPVLRMTARIHSSSAPAPNGFRNQLATARMAINQKLVPMFAQVSIDGPIDNFLKFLGKLLLLVAVAMLCYSGFLFHDGKNREGVFSLIGAFVLAIAVPAAKTIFSIGGGWTN